MISQTLPIKWLKTFKSGVWTQNPALVQLLGLCPLLAVSNNTINSLSLGLATLLVLILSNLILSCLKDIIPDDVRIPLIVTVIATIVTVVQQLMAAFAYPLYDSLGIFLSLITTNCIIMGRVEAFALKHSVFESIIDAISQGSGFLIILLLIGSLRELVGSGTLLANSEHLFGAIASNWTIHLPNYKGLLLVLLPPGAFILLGLLIAGKQYIESK